MTSPLRVLMLEDSPSDAKLVEIELRRAGRVLAVHRVQSAAAMRDALAAGAWDLVLSDWSMPSFSGAEGLRILRETGLDVPFIIVSGTVGEEAAVEAMRAGAHDYVLKDKLVRLNAVVQRELREAELRREGRAATAKLVQQELWYRSLIERSTDGITLTGRDGKLAYVSPAMARIFGYEPDEAVGRSIFEFIDPQDRPKLMAGMRDVRALPVGSSVRYEVRARRRDGSICWMDVHTTNLLDDPVVGAIVGNVRDITEQRRVEDQLRQAQKMESMGRLAGGVAHDFNNVLTVILSVSEMLAEEQSLSAEVRADLEEIRQAGRRAAGLTNQLLMFSRHQVVEPAVLDLDTVLASTEKMLKRILGEDVVLVTRREAALGRIVADRGQIEQVIMNLVVNARDAMPRGGTLTIATANVELSEQRAREHFGAHAGPHVMLSVSDTGCGMDETTVAQIFEPFFTTKDKGKGTGLGLSTVFGIVQAADGWISVETAPGLGTTFQVFLPRVDAVAEPVRPRRQPTSLRGTETILLCEDEEQVRAVTAGILSRAGYEVLVASSPTAAIEIARAHPGSIDALLTDVVMPGMSGPELAEAVLAARPRIAVVCMSGYIDDTITRHGVVDHGYAFVHKPLTPEPLLPKLRDLLDAP